MRRIETAVVSVVPSPYQRDIFRALANRPEIDLKVYYLEAAAPDSPWPEVPQQSYETILPGRWFSIANARFHVVTRFPALQDHSVVILNSLTSTLAQWSMRFRPAGQRLLFWAERLKPQTSYLRKTFQKHLSTPIQNTDAIVAIGSVAENAYHQAFPRLPHFNIPYHCDLGPFLARTARLPQRAEEIVFLFCGQVIARKGVDLLVTAFDRLIQKGFRARLVLVGRRAELDWALTFSSEKSRRYIEYQGFSDPKLLPDVFSKAHVFVLPSRYDGWGVVVNQALGAGLPIICSDAVGAAFDLVQPGINGFRVKAGSVDPLEEAMRLLCEKPESLTLYGAASRELAKEWTPARGAEKWLSVLSHFDR
jgi:glycosyltransferase involved in cell wall biosynthesis